LSAPPGRRRVEAVQDGVVHEEQVAVPQRPEDLALDLLADPEAEVQVLPRVVPGVDPAHDVGAYLVGSEVELDGVALE